MTKQYYAFLLIVLLSIQTSPVLSKINYTVPVEMWEGKSLLNYNYPMLSESMLGQSITLTGIVWYDGYADWINVFQYNGKSIVANRYELGRTSLKSGEYMMAKIQGVFTKNQKDRIIIKVNKLTPINSFNSNTSQAIKDSLDYLEANQNDIDLNQYKKTHRYQQLATLIPSLKKVNFNQVPFKKNSSPQILFYDANKQYMGFDCGKKIIDRKLQYAVYLNYIAIYNLKSKKLEKIAIVYTGYYTEQ